MKTPKTPDKLSSSHFSKFLPEYAEYAERIRKTLYYGKLPATDRPSLPFTSMTVEKFSELCRQDGLEKLDVRYASSVCYDACVTPCSLILALVYLDRLRSHNPEYLANTSPSQVFLVAMMVASKYLYDDGEEDEVFNDEWATSAAVSLTDLNQAEREFLVAIVSHVFAVCIVGYTAAVVSVVAGTLLAQQCSQQMTAVMSRLTCNLSTANETVATCMDDVMQVAHSDHITESLSALKDDIETSLDDGSNGNVSLPGLPSRAITTLTTSILLAMSSPSTPSQKHQHLRSGQKDCQSCHSNVANQNSRKLRKDPHSFCFEPDDSDYDPSDTRLSFTTGPYWLPSSYGRTLGHLSSNAISLDLPNLDLPSIERPVSGQKDDWVYSNPWMIPWLSWHSAPVYSMIQNFSGIGAPNMGGFRRSEYGWVDWLSRMSEMMEEMLSSLAPHTHIVSLPPPPMLSRVDVAHSGPEPVPWII
ncbi:uncharacterized protein [Panulirus ornatus]|uniref:uncharacterized protein isoform X2 n=1 Tax=Panulirus ornatus TaxID=150431 RepID=UPI003A8A9B29